MTNKVLFINTAFRWEFKKNEVIIDKYNYHGRIVNYFKEVYLFFSIGRTKDEFYNEFKQISYITKRGLLYSFLERNILISCLSDITEVFKNQEYVYNGNNTNKKFDDMFQQQEYLMKLSRDRKNYMQLTQKYIDLNIITKCDDVIYKRRSTRVFDTESKISLEQISKLLNVARLEQLNGINRGNYPSAGALYPLDIYLYIKENRVDGIDKGIYFFDVYNNRLVLVNNCTLSKNIHYGSNGDIFDSSAISVFIIFNGDISMQKYGGRAYFYAILEAGILLECFSLVVEEEGLGSCIIGDMKHLELENNLNLHENSKWIISMEIGNK